MNWLYIRVFSFLSFLIRFRMLSAAVFFNKLRQTRNSIKRWVRTWLNIKQHCWCLTSLRAKVSRDALRQTSLSNFTEILRYREVLRRWFKNVFPEQSKYTIIFKCVCHVKVEAKKTSNKTKSSHPSQVLEACAVHSDRWNKRLIDVLLSVTTSANINQWCLTHITGCWQNRDIVQART